MKPGKLQRAKIDPLPMLNGTVTSSRECTLELPTTSMADGGEDIFLFGDDFDAILDLLEQDEDMEEHFKASVENVSMIRFLFD